MGTGACTAWRVGDRVMGRYGRGTKRTFFPATVVAPVRAALDGGCMAAGRVCACVCVCVCGGSKHAVAHVGSKRAAAEDGKKEKKNTKCSPKNLYEYSNPSFAVNVASASGRMRTSTSFNATKVGCSDASWSPMA